MKHNLLTTGQDRGGGAIRQERRGKGAATVGSIALRSGQSPTASRPTADEDTSEAKPQTVKPTPSGEQIAQAGVGCSVFRNWRGETLSAPLPAAISGCAVIFDIESFVSVPCFWPKSRFARRENRHGPLCRTGPPGKNSPHDSMAQDNSHMLGHTRLASVENLAGLRSCEKTIGLSLASPSLLNGDSKICD